MKIFFGACVGVGKTCAMLERAQRQREDGIDVVVGWVDTHGRPEAEALLTGLETLPSPNAGADEVWPPAFDLDAALARQPQLLLLDKLAHANATGARHSKRWQDVEELLDAGIDVGTTLNVQELESLRDVVARITGVAVRETVPDQVFATADEVELVDLPPDEILERLAEGRIPIEERAHAATQALFRKGNLIALRQLALRATAERVDAAMREYRGQHGIVQPWAAGERLLVCIGPDRLSERLVRSARRMASALDAQWFAVYVETPALAHLPQAARDPILRTLKLAEQLGADTSNLSGESVAETLLDFARLHNVNRIVVGKPMRPGWRERLRPSLVDTLVRTSGAIDIHVINSESTAAPVVPPRLRFRLGSRWPAYLWSLLVVALATLVSLQMGGVFERTNIVMVYLLGTVLVAARFGYGPSVLAAVLGVVLFDFLFVEPTYSFDSSDTQFTITFAVMLTTALLISHLTATGKRQASVARQRERRTAELYALSRELGRRRSIDELAKFLCRHVVASVDGEAAVLLPDSDGKIQDPTRFCDRGMERDAASIVRYPVPGNDLGVAQWAWDHHEKAGLATDTLATASAIYLPLNALQRCVGVLGLRPKDPRQLQIPEQMHLIEAQVNQAAVAMERAQLAGSVRDAEPASTRLDASLPPEVDPDLQCRPFALQELVAGAMQRAREQRPDSPLAVQIPDDLPLAYGDETMLERAVSNLIRELARQAPAQAVELVARNIEGTIEVTLHDPGRTPAFGEPVYQAEPGTRDGNSLGVAISRAIIEAHGGTFDHSRTPAGGVGFRFSLPPGPAANSAPPT